MWYLSFLWISTPWQIVHGSLAWENSRHLAKLPLVSPANDVWETNAEISYVMTRHYADLSRASDWSSRVGNLIQPIRSTTQMSSVWNFCVRFSNVIRHGGETSGSIAKCQLFSQANGSRKKKNKQPENLYVNYRVLRLFRKKKKIKWSTRVATQIPAWTHSPPKRLWLSLGIPSRPRVLWGGELLGPDPEL